MDHLENKDPWVCRGLLRGVCAFCLLAILFPRQALALSLLYVDDIGQSVGAACNMSRGTRSGAPAETSREFHEDYGIGFDFALLSPQLIKGNTSLNLQWQQDTFHRESGSGSGKQFSILYNINTQILPSSYYPVSVSAASTQQTISAPFTPAYGSQADDLSVNVSVLNAVIPSQFRFSQQSQETSGLQHDVRQSSHSLSFNSRPNLRDFGNLSLGVNLVESDSDSSLSSSNSRDASARAAYNVGWRSGAGYSRSFSLNYALDQSAGTTTREQRSLNSALSWQFGKVLDGNASYFMSTNSSPLFTSESKGGSASLSHTLMGNLTTGLTASASQDDFDKGKGVSYGAGGRLGYRKKLPDGAALSLSYSYSRNRTERTGEASILTALSEGHPIPTALLGHITLEHASFIKDSIEVTGVQSGLIYPASFYTVVPEGIALSDRYAVDSDVSISYRYKQDPSVTTLGTSHGAGANLQLAGGKYKFYANMTASDSRLVSGEATSLTVSSTRRYVAGGEASLGAHGVGGEMGYNKSFSEAEYYLSSRWQYSTSYAGGSVNFAANDLYTRRESSEGNNGGWTNTLSVHGGYSRSYGRVQARFKCDYANSLLDDWQMSHVASVNANLEARFGKLSCLLNSNATWNFSPGGTSSSQAIGLGVRRAF